MVFNQEEWRGNHSNHARDACIQSILKYLDFFLFSSLDFLSRAMATNNPNGDNPEAAATRAAQQVTELLRSHLQNLESQSEAELHEAAQERAVADAQFTEVCFRNESFS